VIKENIKKKLGKIKINIKTTLYTMIKVCIFNKSDDVFRFDSSK